MAESLVKVDNGHIIISILNTREQDVGLPNPVVKVISLRDSDVGENAVIGVAEQERGRDDPGESRGERVIAKLRTDHLNSEEKKSLHELCFDYQDVYFLPGDKLLHKRGQAFYTVAAGDYPINTCPYRLPESQKEGVDRQVKQLLEDEIIAKSDFPWNSTLLVVPKRVGPDGKRKWRLMVDIRKLYEKTIGNAYPLPEITEILDQLGQSKYFHA